MKYVKQYDCKNKRVYIVIKPAVKIILLAIVGILKVLSVPLTFSNILNKLYIF